MPPRAMVAVAAAGALACLVGLVIDPVRLAVSYLAAYLAGLTVVLGALALVMIAHVTGATWFVVLRRRAEDVVATLPLFAVLFVPVLVGVAALYPWAMAPDRLSPDLRAELAKKTAYLNLPFVGARAVLYWGTWLLLGEALRRTSLRQDEKATDALARRMYLVSAIGLPAYALTLTFAAFDWMMSLDPAWSSTIYGVYVFAGAAVGAVAMLAVLVRWPRRGPDAALHRAVSAEHLHALGKLLLTFVMFWVYVGYAQLLIIWIGDVPKEVSWYVARSGVGWSMVAALLVAGHFALPFLLLLLRAVTRSGLLLALLGAWLLALHYVDIYWLVLPSYTPRVLRPHWLDLAALALVVGLAGIVAAWRTRGHAAVPRGDPALARSLRYHPD